ncbi:MAG: hypothetical protein ABI742_13425, partial [Gemmatimonadota bacterium]
AHGGWLWGFRHAVRWYRRRDGGRLAAAGGLRLVAAHPAGGLTSLLVDGARYTFSALAARMITGLVYLRYAGDRARARAAHPWLPNLTNLLQFAHLRVPPGRWAHRLLNRVLLRTDAATRCAPTQWLFIFEKPAK